MTDTATRLAAAEQIIRAVANTLPPSALTSAHLLHAAADDLARDHARIAATEPLAPADFWETI